MGCRQFSSDSVQIMATIPRQPTIAQKLADKNK